MVIKWKEHENSEEDELAMENEGVMEALRNCGLKKILPNTMSPSPTRITTISDQYMG